MDCCSNPAHDAPGYRLQSDSNGNEEGECCSPAAAAAAAAAIMLCAEGKEGVIEAAGTSLAASGGGGGEELLPSASHPPPEKRGIHSDSDNKQLTHPHLTFSVRSAFSHSSLNRRYYHPSIIPFCHVGQTG